MTAARGTPAGAGAPPPGAPGTAAVPAPATAAPTATVTDAVVRADPGPADVPATEARAETAYALPRLASTGRRPATSIRPDVPASRDPEQVSARGWQVQPVAPPVT
jgi:hypothetical protein